MKGKRRFTREEAEKIRRLLVEKQAVDPTRQKAIRDRIRKIGFSITEFGVEEGGFTRAAFDQLVANGSVVIESESPRRPEGIDFSILDDVTDAPRGSLTVDPFSRSWLDDRGFVGYLTFEEIMKSPVSVPREGGIYVVMREPSGPATFLDVSVGGHFKAKDPTVGRDVLSASWVTDSSTLYIGKANSLRNRLIQFAKFGRGVPIGHWGGRYIWQLVDSNELLVAWRPTAATGPREAERALLAEFIGHFGRRPFANLTG